MNTGFIYAIGAAIMWGLVYTLDQKILKNASPIALLFFDSILTALLMLPFLFFSHSIKPILQSGKINLALMILSVILAGIASFCIFSAIKIMGSADASIIEIAYPFFVVLFTYLFFKSTPNIYFLLGGLLVFAGSIIIIKFS
ncbi:MAG: DMT family transporter [Candidatus Nomurabacteria bacterium]|nr:DMT family transporter [Candidatus Nomurabacteria bacterium]